ncbi:MAG: DUF3426 domain-containing protein [Burkholderiaceae bacterium]|nr:DUF3426 domain-containing protein [Burkholderiaceae bacterium]
MALATTCPQCKTSFKVIPDQLKLRRGLVRCGVCQHVFSGIDYLRYVDDSGKSRQKGAAAAARAGGAAAPQPSPRPAGAAGPATRMAAAPRAEASPQTVIAAEDELKTAFFLSDSTFGPYSQTRPQDVVPPRSIVARGDDPSLAEPAQAPRARGDRESPDTEIRAPRDTRDAGEGRGDREARGERMPRDGRGSEESRRRHRVRDEDDPEVAAASLLAREARDAWRGSGRRSHASRWHAHDERNGPYDSPEAFFADPRRRYGTIALAVIALLQLTLLFRNEIASRAPVLRPAVSVLAGIFGQNVDAVRSLSSLTIESFELQSKGRDDLLSMNAVLRNRDSHVVRWPAMELTLTDQAGTVMVRKVILPGDYLNRAAPRDGLAGRSEWPVRLELDPGSLQLAGYSVALFYP